MAKAKRRRKRDLVTYGKIELQTEFIDNPDWRPDLEGEKGFPRKVRAAVNIRESAVGTLAARNLIDKAQAEAATRFRKHWETTGGVGARAIDYSRDKVDGGKIADPIELSQLRAAKKLEEAERTLGERNYNLVRSVCGEGKAMTELFMEKRERLTATDNLRASLDDLCRIWGIAGTGPSRAARNHQPPSKEETALYTSRTAKKDGCAKIA